MKKVNRNKLNNKGFTLIELLAVVVILAVVMGIAMTSVLSAMNSSRAGSLHDSALIIADAFNKKYTESLVNGTQSNVYGDVITNGNGYNFTTNASYYLHKDLAGTFNIAENGYAFVNSDSATNTNADTSVTVNSLIAANAVVKNSFVTFNASTGKFVVCLFANNAGSYYVDGYKEDADTAIGTTTIKGAANTMYACSDGTKSW